MKAKSAPRTECPCELFSLDSSGKRVVRLFTDVWVSLCSPMAHAQGCLPRPGVSKVPGGHHRIVLYVLSEEAVFSKHVLLVEIPMGVFENFSPGLETPRQQGP